MAKKDIATTAFFVAAVRARENERSDPLFHDELSVLLAGPEGMAWLAVAEKDPQSNYHRDSFPYLEVRTRYFDDWAMQALRESRSQQLVILGAGLDTRAFRLPFPDDLRLWEVDTPELFSLKEKRLQAAGVRLDRDRITVPADLTSQDWVEALTKRGLKTKQPTVWLAEGLFQYLRAGDVNQILRSASSASSVGSKFGAEVISKDYLRSISNSRALQRRKQRGTPWVFGTNDPERLFKSHGWSFDGKVTPLEAAMAFSRYWGSREGASRRPRASPPGAFFVSATKA